MTAPDANTVESALVATFLREYPGDAAAELEEMPDAAAAATLQAAPAHDAAAILVRLDPDKAAQLVSRLNDQEVVAVCLELHPRDAASLLARLEANDRDRVLGKLEKKAVDEIQAFLSYPQDAAGKLMDPRFVVCRSGETVAAALAHVRSHPDRRILDLCIVDNDLKLIGLIPMQLLATTPDQVIVDELLTKPALRVTPMTQKEEIVELLEKAKSTTLPVCDFDGRVLGVIRHDELVNAARQDAIADMQSMVGASREERAKSSALFAVKKRLAWLQINLLTAFLAAAVVGMFEKTIAQVTALAVLLPVVAGQSGNTGAQALAVTLRGLALREVRPREWPQLVRKEAGAGFINGVAVALTTGLGVLIWSQSLALAGVIAISMVTSMIMAGIAGASIPVILTSIGQDPAQSSSIVLTTVTDVAGFFSFLGLATVFIHALPTGVG